MQTFLTSEPKTGAVMHLEKANDENIAPISVLFSPFILAIGGKNGNITVSALNVRNCKHRMMITRVLCLALESCDPFAL